MKNRLGIYDNEYVLLATNSSTSPPEGMTVVSRYADGTVASYYMDVVWDWSPYSHNNTRQVLSFKFWKEGEEAGRKLSLANELRWILFVVIAKRSAPRLSFSSLQNYLKVGRELARFCEKRRITVESVLTDHERITDFIADIPEYHITTLAAILSVLASLGKEAVGYEVLGKTVSRRLRAKARQYAATNFQHPPLPTRIYSHLIATLNQELTEFEKIMDKYLLLIKDYTNDRTMLSVRGIDVPGLRLHKEGVVNEYGLLDYFNAKGLDLTNRGIKHGLYEAQIAARLSVHLYTGMRSDEAALLPYDCLKTNVRNGVQHYYISGITTKFNRGLPKETKWVTSTEGARAVRIAQKISKFIIDNMDLASSDISIKPLFVSVVFTGLSDQSYLRRNKVYPSKLDLRKTKDLRDRIQATITEDDLLELESIDPNRAWRSEANFHIGKPWKITSHQLRRSLALYAQRSGLVSLPSLRRQLQHITEEMSLYYARGSSFARDFIGKNKDHIGKDWQETQPVSSALSYIINVLLTNDILFGGHANWLDHRVRDENRNVVVDREKTIKRFERGQLAYKETLLGGCVSTEECDKVAIKWMSPSCIDGCKNFIGRLPKLERAINVYTKMLKNLDKNTMEYQTEKAELDTLVAARNRVQQMSISKD